MLTRDEVFEVIEKMICRKLTDDEKQIATYGYLLGAKDMHDSQWKEDMGK
jgi:hypothetical protein